MNILILGSGGREHALAWKIHKSPKCEKIYVAPGNAGTSQLAINLDFRATDFPSIRSAILTYKISLVIIGPEEPLVLGVADAIRHDPQLMGVGVVGPGKEGAQLEGSKDFSKKFMEKYNVPTAKCRTFTRETLLEGLSYLSEITGPYVLKADGLAAGKGVIISENLQEAQDHLVAMLNGQFGDASQTVLIEQFLSGIELSMFVLTDGNEYCLLPEAKDYKRIGEGDTGPNTGGMGAVSPVLFADRIFIDKVKNKIIIPTLAGLRNEGIEYKGFIFLGLMNVGNEPYVIEYNARLGDPETEVILPRISSDFLEALVATAQGTLRSDAVELSSFTAATVVLVSEGYPGEYKKGEKITIKESPKSLIFHAGTKESEGELLTNGGRVLAVTSLGKNMTEAIQSSYQTIQGIHWSGKTFRKDIGMDLSRLGQ